MSSTVENRAKDLIAINKDWQYAINVCDNMGLLQNILMLLELKKQKKELNNNGLVRMIRGYFYEMACVIQECYRFLWI